MILMVDLDKRELLWINNCSDTGKKVVIIIHSCSNSLNCTYPHFCLQKAETPENFLKDLKYYNDAVCKEVLRIFNKNLSDKNTIIADTDSIIKKE